MKKFMLGTALLAASLMPFAADAAPAQKSAKEKPPVIQDTSCFKPLTFRGKPFFVLGNWDSRTERNYNALDPFLQGAGMNTFIIGIDLQNEKTYQENLATFRWFRDNHPEIAIIIELQVPFVTKDLGNKKYSAVPANEIPAREAKLIEALKELRSYGNILGYTIDELENRLYHTVDDYRKAKGISSTPGDTDLAAYMADATKWIRDAIKKHHPEALYMPVQAWWTTYDQHSELFDVLMADEYPAVSKPEEFFYVGYDAQKAAWASKKFNKRCFIYIPPGFNVLGGRWAGRNYTRAEMRYFWFSPISSGAMGIMGWRHRRTTPDFTQNVLYPVMNEVKSMVPWFLGENYDKYVFCNRTGDFIEHKILRRSKMVENEEDNYTYRYVRPISWIMRRNPADGSFLLLACNNSNVEQECYFVLDRKFINVTYALELFSQTTTGGVIGRFKVKLKPYEVKAYMLPDAARQPKK